MKLPRCCTAALALGSALLFLHTASADDLKTMEGTWKVQTAEVGGKQIEAGELKEIVVTIKGETYEVAVKSEKIAGNFKLDESTKPKSMDATDTNGASAGKLLKAIYELTGDTLRVCYATDGGARPGEFATREGTPSLMLTYLREKKTE